MDVLFPFGYGLSYTTFEYSGLKLSADKIKDTDTVTVTVTVKNTGKRAGKTVAQVYVGDVEGYVNAIRPVRELKAFKKVELQPGESKEVSFTLCKRAFATWRSEIHDWFVESGEFSIEVGDSSACLPLKATVTVESTQKLPAHYDMNSIVMDLMKDPKAKEVIAPLISGAAAIFGDGEGGSEAANEAVTEEMSMAMMQYMPLRSMLGFSGGSVTGEMIDKMLKKMNE